jgi:hypothetical protein
MGAPAVQHFGWKCRALHWLAVAADTGFIPGNGEERRGNHPLGCSTSTPVLHNAQAAREAAEAIDERGTASFRFFALRAHLVRVCQPGVAWLDINVKLDMHFSMHADRTINAAICCCCRYRLP